MRRDSRADANRDDRRSLHGPAPQTTGVAQVEQLALEPPSTHSPRVQAIECGNIHAAGVDRDARRRFHNMDRPDRGAIITQPDAVREARVGPISCNTTQGS